MEVVVRLGIIVVWGRVICFSMLEVGDQASEGGVEQATSRMVMRIRVYGLLIKSNYKSKSPMKYPSIKNPSISLGEAEGGVFVG